MKKIIIIALSGLLLAGCSEHKDLFQQAVKKELSNDKDLKDYELDSDEMSRCVVDTAAEKMPGLFPFDPDRMNAYKGYTKLITLKSAEKPQEVLKELQEIFGPGDAVAKAQRNYSESVFVCFQNLVSKTDPDAQISLN